jgi:hypothetical protein
MYIYTYIKSRDSVVGIATGYRLDDLGAGIRVSVGSRIFSTLSRAARGPTQIPIQWVPGALSVGVKWPGHEAHHSPPTSAEVKKMWICTSTPSYVFMRLSTGTPLPLSLSLSLSLYIYIYVCIHTHTDTHTHTHTHIGIDLSVAGIFIRQELCGCLVIVMKSLKPGDTYTYRNSSVLTQHSNTHMLNTSILKPNIMGSGDGTTWLIQIIIVSIKMHLLSK